MKLNLKLSYSNFFKLIYVLILIVSLFACADQEEKTETKDNIDLGFAIAFKGNECGGYPNYPLFLANGSAKPAKRDMQACSLTIVQQKCPFIHYPVYCLKIYKNFEYEFKNPLEDKDK